MCAYDKNVTITLVVMMMTVWWCINGDDEASGADDDYADEDDDDADDNVADTCSLGLLQRPGGQKIVADKEKRLSLLLWLNCVNQQTNKQIKK